MEHPPPKPGRRRGEFRIKNPDSVPKEPKV
jgi:hypothetical protein